MSLSIFGKLLSASFYNNKKPKIYSLIKLNTGLIIDHKLELAADTEIQVVFDVDEEFTKILFKYPSGPVFNTGDLRNLVIKLKSLEFETVNFRDRAIRRYQGTTIDTINTNEVVDSATN
jgi:hypothetical protein